MKLIFTLIITCLIAITTSGQLCHSPVAGNNIIKNDTTISSFGRYYFCTGLNVTFTAGAIAFFEDSCTVVIDGNIGNFNFKQHCKVTLNSGTNNIVVYDSTTTFIDNATNTFPTICPLVTFDYTGLPANSCTILTSVEKDLRANNAIKVFPNPAKDQLWLEGLPTEEAFMIYDQTGRLVLSGRSRAGEAIEIGKLSTGIFLIRGESYAKRFIVE